MKVNFPIFDRLNFNIMLTEKDLQQLSERNINENQVIQQVAQLKRGTQYVQLMRPATIGDGILRLDEEKVNMMTPEFIHINSFMYEPLIDLSIHHLVNLYNECAAL